MNYFNFQHLYYFWRVGVAGSVSGAAKELRLAQPTVSSQLKTFEDNIGEQLFSREGRQLRLTTAGKVAMRYAGDIFNLGEEFIEALKGNGADSPAVVHIGIADVLPKLLMYRILGPLLSGPNPIRVTCYENRPERLLAELSIDELDLVLSDTPLSPTFRTKTHSHFLGESGISFFAVPELARKYRRNFPSSLDSAPVLIPTENSTLRRSLDYFFNEHDIRPHVVGEFEDSASLKIFASRGHGICAAATIIEKEVQEETGMRVIGRIDSIIERCYAITIDRQIENPAVAEIFNRAKEVFAEV